MKIFESNERTGWTHLNLCFKRPHHQPRLKMLSVSDVCLRMRIHGNNGIEYYQVIVLIVISGWDDLNISLCLACHHIYDRRFTRGILLVTLKYKGPLSDCETKQSWIRSHLCKLGSFAWCFTDFNANFVTQANI